MGMCAITKAPETIGKVKATDGVMGEGKVEATGSVGGVGDIRSFIKKTRRRCGSPKKFVQLPIQDRARQLNILEALALRCS